MGFAKRLLDRQIELGFTTLGNKNVCVECFGDYAIKEYVKSNATSAYCDYCDRESKDGGLIATDVDVVLEYIILSIRFEWGNPDDEGVWYDSSEGGYQGTEIYDGWDFVSEILCEEMEIDSDSLLFTEIRDALVDTVWCVKDPYTLAENEEAYLSWQLFSEQVKYKTRYVFYESLKDNDETSLLSPQEILGFIGSIIRDLNLVVTVPKQKFYRARISSNGEKFTTSKALGTPPIKFAKVSNRMSPAGIPMFYGAINSDTALKEVGYFEEDGLIASIGEFINTSQLKILDLTSLPEIPSIFDTNNRHKRWVIKFLYSFLSDFTKPIKKDGREHIEYVPTQIVTEYFRHVYTTNENYTIDGIAYPSSVTGDEAYVLFFNNDECVERDEIEKCKSQLYLNESNFLYKTL